MSISAKRIIDLAAFRHNLARIRELAPGKHIIAMVKSNAYGHDLVPICNQVPTDITLGVVELQRAIELRQHHIQNPIILMSGVFTTEELNQAIANKLELVVHQAAQIDLLSADTFLPSKIWLKINTGMNRLGIPLDQAAASLSKLANIKHVDVVGILSHFSAPEEPNSSITLQQINGMQQLEQLATNKQLSFCNSMSLLNDLYPAAQWIRPGIMLYGVSPDPDRNVGLKPVMTLTAPIIGITDVKQGDQVGYVAGYYTAATNMKIACLKLGYGDGYLRQAPNGTPTWYKGHICPIVGRVSMNYITIDISAVPDAKLYDTVELWGNNLSINTVAKAMQTIPYELTTHLHTNLETEYRGANE